MTIEAKSLVDRVFLLPAEAREEVLTHLIERLDTEQPPSPSEQQEIDDAWSAEIARRVREIEAGQAELLDGDQALADIRSKFGV